MTGYGAQHGFSLVEALVALLIFSVVAAGLAETLVTAQTTRRTSTMAMAANQLAVAELERNRAGTPAAGSMQVGDFTSTTVVQPISDYPALARVRVLIEWEDRGPRQLELTTLIPDGA